MWEFFYTQDRVKGAPGGTRVKNPLSNAGDSGQSPGLERSTGVENGNQLQYSCLRSPMDKGVWWATVHGVAELDMIEWLSTSKRN